jgi:hypothetical protein
VPTCLFDSADIMATNGFGSTARMAFTRNRCRLSAAQTDGNQAATPLVPDTPRDDCDRARGLRIAIATAAAAAAAPDPFAARSMGC